MKVGDLVQYVDAELLGDDIGMIVARWFSGVADDELEAAAANQRCPAARVVGGTKREIVNVLWDNGVYQDHSCEFKVVS